jgi:hypothetical protein
LGVCRIKVTRERYFTDNPGFESNINYTEVLVLIDDNYMGVERGFVPRTEAVTRLLQPWILARADRFHGAWPHWINEQRIPLAPKKDKVI